MSTIDIKSIQNDADGSQLRNAFRIINTVFGTEIVDVSTIQNTQNKYADRVATGSQLKDAFEAINTALGTPVVDINSIQNVCNGNQLRDAFIAINEVIDGDLKPELVTNGNFSDGDTGWTGLVVTNGVAKTFDTTGYQAISTVAGVEYELNFDCDNAGVSPLLAIQDGVVPPGAQIVGVDCSGGGAGMRSYSTTFTAISTNSIVVVSNGSNTAEWDNISVKKIL